MMREETSQTTAEVGDWKPSRPNFFVRTGANRIINWETEDPIFCHYAQHHTDVEKLNLVIEKYPVRITSFLKKLMENSEAIRQQYLPSPRELHTYGTPTPFEEGKKSARTYGLERLYRDRVLLTPHFDCPAYCRFCYKKSRVMRGKRGMTYQEIDEAVAEVGKMEEVRGVLVTGGDPFMNVEKLFYLLDQVVKLDNIHEIRVGTRCLLTQPEIFTPKLCDQLAGYIRPNFSHPSQSKYLAINVHFNHPDELAPEVIHACYQLTSRGITLRNQAVLLKGINDDIATIKTLFALLLRNNMIPYYLNHCMPVEGSDHLRTTVQKGLDIYRQLCTESSTIIPNYVYAPSGGKVHVGPDSQFEYLQENGSRYIRVKMLYQTAEFQKITHKELPPRHRTTEDGFIEGLYVDGMDA
ncbi:radical SAM protein [candidate division KSB1 bacterium]|nr:radical SAM protein [candidate division KSB1 bacterium]